MKEQATAPAKAGPRLQVETAHRPPTEAAHRPPTEAAHRPPTEAAHRPRVEAEAIRMLQRNWELLANLCPPIN